MDQCFGEELAIGKLQRKGGIGPVSGFDQSSHRQGCCKAYNSANAQLRRSRIATVTDLKTADATSSAHSVAEVRMARIVVAVDKPDSGLEDLVDKSACSKSLADPAGNVQR